MLIDRMMMFGNDFVIGFVNDVGDGLFLRCCRIFGLGSYPL
jgi:hypothetical protein